MRHYVEGVLQAYLDDEVSAAERAGIATHIESCDSCAAELGELRNAATLFSSSVASLDSAVSLATAGSLRAQAKARRRWLWVTSGNALTRAALLILGLTAAAAAAVPGSPVRRLVDAAIRSLSGSVPRTATIQESPAVVAAPPAIPTGGAAIATRGTLHIALTNTAKGNTYRVRLIEGANAGIETSGDAGSARFRSGEGRIEMIGGGTGEVLILVPHSVIDGTVEVDGVTFFRKVGSALRFPGPAPDSTSGDYLFRTN